MTDPLQDRTYLHDRHRLSHRQIDRWLGEESGQTFLPEKMKQLQAVRNFLNVTDLLRQNGVSFIPLKGPLLSFRIYGDPTVRFSHDIDLLVEVEMIEPVTKILYANGYRLSEGVIWPKKKVQQEMVIDSSHHLSFSNKELNLCVEVHWVLMPGLPFPIKKQKAIVAENLMEVDFAGRKFSVLTKEFELLYLMIHGAKHGWSRLKWLVDINEYHVNEVNEIVLGQLVRKFNAGRIVAQTNELLKRYFSTQLPFASKARLPGYFIRYALQSIDGGICENLSIHDHLRLYRYLWLMFPGLFYKYKMILDAFCRPADIPAIDSSFKLAYYFYRPYSFIKRRIVHA
jgi:hypothetical protein